MNLWSKLKERAEAGRPIRVGMIGAGKFGAMFLAQARLTPGIQILGISDLNPERARQALRRTGWSDEQFAARDFADALKSGSTFITDDSDALIRAQGLDILIEATGNPEAGIHHALLAIENGRHLIMVNVEADVVAGPLLARKARQAGLVYSLAYGDQPAIICEQIDWARACGFTVVSAGKGTRYHPSFHQSTPDTVWENFGLSPEIAKKAGNNPKMFNSFIDGTKSGIEMTAVCNAAGLTPQPNGLAFPPSSCEQLAEICKPKSEGGTLALEGTTEVVSSLNRDMSPVPNHLQIGTYVVVKGENDFVRLCIEEYRFFPDKSFKYSAMFRPAHLIGLELGISVASIGLRGEATGSPTEFRSDVVATTKRDLKAGEMLDGEGGYCVWGKQVPAAESLRIGGLPLGLAQNVKLKRDKKLGEPVLWSDVEIDETSQAVKIRREMEAAFSPAKLAAE